MTTTLATLADIPAVLDLQEKYLFRNMTAEARLEGFVTTPFTTAQVEAVLAENGLFVVKNEEDELIAYAFAASWAYFEQWEIFNYMVSRFPALDFRGRSITTANSFQYGPVCIEKAYRGRGVLHLLFEAMRLEFVKKYPIGITFINQVNTISTVAHTRKLGWEIIDRFSFNDNHYLALGYDMVQSVIPPQ